jgi:hypothetical protein
VPANRKVAAMLTREVAWITDETARRRSEKQQGRFGRGSPEWMP